jgi:hypothetical protein
MNGKATINQEEKKDDNSRKSYPNQDLNNVASCELGSNEYQWKMIFEDKVENHLLVS